jgi:hypothetical protein
MCCVFGSSESERAQPTDPGLGDDMKSVPGVRLLNGHCATNFREQEPFEDPKADAYELS